jgi:hypothetical protein
MVDRDDALDPGCVEVIAERGEALTAHAHPSK